MFSIIEIAIGFISAYFLFSILKNLILPRDPKPIWILSFFILYGLCSAIIYADEAESTLLTLLCFLIYIFLFFKGESSKKLSITIIVYPILVVINYITQDIGFLIWNNNQEMPQLAADILHCFTMLLRIPAWYGIWRLSRSWMKEFHLLTFRMLLIIDIMCMASFIGIITVINLTPINSSLLSYPTIFACLLTNIGSLYLSGYIASTITSSMELHNLRYQESYYAELDKSQKNIKKLRHDMHNHLNVIETFLRDKNFSEAEQYFQELSGEFIVSNRVFCKNSIVNAVLNAKYNLALANQIDCFFNISINGMIGISDISLCTLFANTLDNAIEANEKIPDVNQRYMSLKARFERSFFCYEISNTKINIVHTKKDKYLTEKDDKSLHGFGLQSVVDIVEKYDGNIDISYTDTTFTIIIFIGNL